jgi:hypothetical protein
MYAASVLASRFELLRNRPTGGKYEKRIVRRRCCRSCTVFRQSCLKKLEVHSQIAFPVMLFLRMIRCYYAATRHEYR